MGGGGASSKGASRAPNGYRTVKKVGRTPAIRSNKGQGLPIKATSKAKVYRIDNKGKISQYRRYDKKGNASIDVDWSHGHNGIPRGTPHIHIWKNGIRGDGRRLTPYEMKKYHKIIERGINEK
ncbi:MAG: polymorphic toxin type 24 domain-containing protein [Victivallaceae bacterium]